MAGPVPMREVSPEVTQFFLRDAAMTRGNPNELTSVELDEAVGFHDNIGLKRLANAGAAAKGFPSERDMLSIENHHHTANYLRAVRRSLFPNGAGAGAMQTPDALARASGIKLQWNVVPGEFPPR